MKMESIGIIKSMCDKEKVRMENREDMGLEGVTFLPVPCVLFSAGMLPLILQSL